MQIFQPFFADLKQNNFIINQLATTRNIESNFADMFFLQIRYKKII